MGLMMLVFWTAVVVVVVALVRKSRHDDSTPDSGSLHHAAERLLNERFAKGEIDEEEFVRRRDVLRR